MFHKPKKRKTAPFIEQQREADRKAREVVNKIQSKVDDYLIEFDDAFRDKLRKKGLNEDQIKKFLDEFDDEMRKEMLDEFKRKLIAQTPEEQHQPKKQDLATLPASSSSSSRPASK